MFKPAIKSISKFVSYLTVIFFLNSGLSIANEDTKPTVLMKTTLGEVEIELFSKRAPKSVKNFLDYVQSGYYTNTLFHRVIPNFMVQGGGFDETFNKKTTNTPIVNESSEYTPNLRGTISMARTNNPNSATSQFFINVVNNASLNKNATSPGYAVFGQVTKGIEIADQMSRVTTKQHNGMRNVPVSPIVIQSISLKKNDATPAKK